MAADCFRKRSRGCARCLDTYPPTSVEVEVIGSGPIGASCWKTGQLSFSIGGEGKTRANVIKGKVRKFSDNLFWRHSTRKVFQTRVCNSHPCSSNARFPASLVRLNGDDRCVIHRGSSQHIILTVK
jgi:hypothetical protein